MKKKIMKLSFVFITQIQAAETFRLEKRTVPVRITLRDEFHSESHESYPAALAEAQRIACSNAYSVIIACWNNVAHKLTFHINPTPEALAGLLSNQFVQHLEYVWDDNNEAFQIKKSLKNR